MSQEVLVKSRDRVENFGEVFTPANIVDDMLNTLPDELFEKNKTFLEPSCGEGVFLVEILKRKLDRISSKKDAIWCVSTLYGIDIQEDNIKLSKDNIFNVWKDWSNGRYDEVDDNVRNIIETNIILGDFLDAKNVEITEYEFSETSDDVKIRTQKLADIAHSDVTIMSFFDDYEEIIKKYWQI